MSIRALDWAWRQECANPQEKLVLLALADHAGHEGTCYPATGSIGVKCQMSAQSVRRHLTALESRGVIEKIERRRRRDGTLSVWMYGLRLDQSSPAASGPVVTSERTSDHDCALGQSLPVMTHEPSISEPSLNPLPESPRVTQVGELLESWESSFVKFWSRYPRKTGKQSAQKRWKSMNETEQVAALTVVGDHVCHWSKSGTDQKFIPHAATWLNGRRWEDELVTDWAPAGSLARQVARFALDSEREVGREDSGSNSGDRRADRSDHRLER